MKKILIIAIAFAFAVAAEAVETSLAYQGVLKDGAGAAAITGARQIKFRLYTAATDPFSISKFPQGWDPEAYSNLSAYIVKTFTVGAQITF